LDKAFSRASRAGKGKIGGLRADTREIEETMLLTAGNILADNLRNSTRDWPSLDRMSDFYRELTDIVAGIEKIKMSLASVEWASEKSKSISRMYVGIVRKSPDPIPVRKQAYGRMASIIYDIDKDLRFLNDARNKLRGLPDVKDEPTIVVAGYPNVGKSSFVASITGARPEIASYPFTTKSVSIGHFIISRKRYQVIDTPGLLDRPIEERNAIERQAVSALRHVADVLLYILDPSESCGYTIGEQVGLLEDVQKFVGVPMLVVANKVDITKEQKPVQADMSMSTLTGEGVKEVKEKLVAMMKESGAVKKKASEVPEPDDRIDLPPSRKKRKE
jgi:nucleolar GTP-binding protein